MRAWLDIALLQWLYFLTSKRVHSEYVSEENAF